MTHSLRVRSGYWQVLGLLLGWLAGALPLQAQNPQTAPLLPAYFLPKSPTVSELPRFDKTELVNLPTGAAQLHLPLVTATAGPLQLPVGLSYSYSGLQVYQPRELVGLGWTLQAGATIVRHVSGLLDNQAVGPYAGYNPDSIATPSQQFLNRAAHQSADTGPDVYTFSLPGGPTGSFLLRDTTAVLLPRQPLRVRLLRGSLNAGFQISLEDGRRYQFEASEASEKTHSAGEFGLGTFVSAWHLTRLISADNADTLRLYYTQYSSAEPTPRRFAVTTSRYGLSGTTNDGRDCHGSYTWSNVITFGTQISPQYLDSITSRGACVLFVRDPATQACRQVRQLRTLGGRQETRRFTLFQSYFSSTGAGSTDPHLRLDSVQESGLGRRLPPYRLRYLATDLPSRSSAAVDYWGYYNGATRNGDAAFSNGPALLEDPQLGTFMPNRQPDFSSSLAGALLQVTYPTGGSSSWEYEPNRVTLGQPTAPSPRRDTTRLALATYYDPNRRAPAPASNKLVTYSAAESFALTEAGTLVLTLERTVQDGNANFNSHYPDFLIWQHLSGGDSTLVTTDPSPVQAYSVAYQQTTRRFQVPCEPGRYTIQLYCESDESFSATLGVPYTFVPPPGPQEGPAGMGVRVRRTRTVAAGGRPLARSYEYLVPDSTQAYGSSVILTSNGAGSAKHTVEIYSLCVRCEFLELTSDASQLGDDLSRYPFYYRCVTVREDSTQGATTSYFVNLDTQFNDVVLVRRQVFQQVPAQPQQLRLVQDERYDYAPDSLSIYPLVRPYLQRSLKAQNGICTDGEDKDVYAVEQAANLVVGPSLLRTTRQTQYDEQGLAHTTLTSQHYQQQRVVHAATRTSTGWRVQRYKRLGDYAPTPALQALQVNGFNPLLETQTWQRSLAGTDSVLVGGQVTLYEPRWRSPARRYQLRLAQPVAAPNQEYLVGGRYAYPLSDTRYEPTASVRYARDTGDLLEERPSQGEPTAYLLGYARTLLIAEVRNARYEQIAYTSFEPLASGRWRYDSTGTHRQAGGRTGRWAYRLDGTASVSRPGLPAGDYELSYWQQGSAPLLVSVGGTPAGGPATLLASAPGGWQQYRQRVHLGAPTTLTLDAAGGGAGLLVDEVRLYPAGARMRSFTHEPLVGESSLTGPDGRTLTYEYDGLGRLVRTRDEQGRILAQQAYHYAGQ